MSLLLVLYVLAICCASAAFVYGIVRPERTGPSDATVHPLHPNPAAPGRPRRLAA